VYTYLRHLIWRTFLQNFLHVTCNSLLDQKRFDLPLCTVRQLVDESVSASDSMQLLWQYNGTVPGPPLLNLQDLQQMRRADAARSPALGQEESVQVALS
jgi:hypothetical protein